jgi:nucleoside-diphosphate-sugar epimerase
VVREEFIFYTLADCIGKSLTTNWHKVNGMELLIGSKGLFATTYTKLFGPHSPILGLGREETEHFFDSHPNSGMEKRRLEKFLKKHKISRLIYSAQHSNYRDSTPENLNELHEINVRRPIVIAEVLNHLGISGVFFSSGSVYSKRDVPILETDCLKTPLISDFYSSSRILMEYEFSLRNFTEEFLIIRPFFMFGQNQKSTTLFPRLVDQVSHNRAIQLDGHLGLVFNPIDVEIATVAVRELLERQCVGFYNLAGLEVTNLKEITSILGEILGKRVEYEFREIEKTQLFIADIQKLQASTQLNLSFDLFQSLERLCKF